MPWKNILTPVITWAEIWPICIFSQTLRLISTSDAMHMCTMFTEFWILCNPKLSKTMRDLFCCLLWEPGHILYNLYINSTCYKTKYISLLLLYIYFSCSNLCTCCIFFKKFKKFTSGNTVRCCARRPLEFYWLMS